MIKNIVRVVRIMIGYILIIVTPYTCYADITSEEISVGCTERSDIVISQVYRGNPNTQLFLVTKGMRVAGMDNLVTDWDEFKSQHPETDLPNSPTIVAECRAYTNGKQVFDVYGLAYESMWPPNKTFTCGKGEGMSITMHTPNDVDQNKYQYVATLFKVRDEHKKRDNELAGNLLTNPLEQFQTG